MKKHLTNIAFFSLFTLSAFAAEDYYIWVDENGVTNYSQRDSKEYHAQHVTQANRPDLNRGRPQAATRLAPAAPAETTAATTAAPAEEIDPDALVAEQAAALASELAEARRTNCEAGKQNLAQLQAFRRVRVTDDKGVNRILTEAEKAEKTDSARQLVRENCSG